MRTEREIKAKLRYLQKRKSVRPNFWNILILQEYEHILEWWRGGNFKHMEVGRRKTRRQ